MKSLLQSNKPPESERRIRANDREYNAQFNYANNYIRTSKYTLLTFLPLNLFEQFQRLANFYFLCLLVLQFIPIISSVTYVTTLVPLVFVLSITAIKDAYDDIQRHRSDSRVNNRKARILQGKHLTDERWSKVQVGDLIQLRNGDFVTADLLLLSTSEPNGLCFIETAELDGETNLKSRQSLMETNVLGQDDSTLGAFNGDIQCEPPNNNLSKFDGTLTWKDNKYSLDNDKILLRGCVLRNTQWCYGVVIFAGKDTKLMMNSGKTKFKRTSIDRLMNALILGIVFFLVLMCLITTIACGIWETVTGYHFQVYLPWDSIMPTGKTDGATVIAILIFFSYLIALNTVVPISLYVSVEVIRLAQSLLINWDEKMYNAENNTSAKARTTTLNEELGQIEYIFSDKTGTLTQNIMTFNKCSINGKTYGDDMSEDGSFRVDFSENPFSEPEFRFVDQNLLDDVKNGDPHVQEFFRLLALCHTVMPEEKDKKLTYQAQSPDENALVSAARNFGFVFKARTPNTITILELGKEVVYELLCILDFNNVRKRMSVVVRKDGQLTLLCKGADSIIYERLQQGNRVLQDKTQEHLNEFAGEGLRTLVLASKTLDPNYFEEWKRRHHDAATSLDNRDDQLDAVYEELERDLQLVGATAIEDKLQDGVPQTIANLALAGIKIWVLTGDKQETAINIGYACELLTDEMAEVFIVDAHSYEDVDNQLSKYQAILDKASIPSKPSKKSTGVQVVTFSLQNPTVLLGVRPRSSNELENGRPPGSPSANEETLVDEVDGPQVYGSYALVINGHSLVHALHSKMEERFLSVASQCKAVICCRVTPLQKAMVVDLVKKYKKAVTLAVGDGANDVSMIKTAHIGVGISGQEGLQAVLASDFSIAQFRFLERLLLVHGRWSYYRMCKFLRYFFYKNFAFTLCHFWFAFFCGFSALTVYDAFYISCYNMFYTASPVVVMAVFDQDINDVYSVKYPKLYSPGIKGMFFNKAEFFKSVMLGVLTSSVLFFVTYGSYHDSISPEGYTTSDHMLFGSVLATNLVIVVNLQIAIETAYWTVLNFVTIIGSILWYFLLTFAYYYVLGAAYAAYIGSLAMAMSGATFWFTLLVIVAMLILPIIGKRFYFVDVRPTLADRLRLKQRMTSRTKQPQELKRTGTAMRRSRRSLRSGYAFSHQEGFGRLITTGKIMPGVRNVFRSKTPVVEVESSARIHSRSASRPTSPPVDSQEARGSADFFAYIVSQVQDQTGPKRPVMPKVSSTGHMDKISRLMGEEEIREMGKRAAAEDQLKESQSEFFDGIRWRQRNGFNSS